MGGGLFKSKKVILTSLIIFLVALVIGVTYAYWKVNEKQTSLNILNSNCLQVTYEDINEGITIEHGYPMSDSDGMKEPYHQFTISNVCENDWASYQINLETLEGTTLNEEYLKVNLSVVGESKVTTKLTSDLNVTPTIDGALRAYKLLVDKLAPGKSITYDLRIWMHKDVTAEDTDSMNATYESKISVEFSYTKEPNYLVDAIRNLSGNDENICPASGVVKVSHTDAEFNDNSEYNKFNLDNTKVKENLTMTEYRYCGANPNNYVSFGDVSTEDRYELIMCVQESSREICQNLGMMPDFGIKEFYTDNGSCIAKKEELQPMLDQMASGGGQEVSYSLECKKTLSVGDPINLWRIIGLVNTPEGQRVKLVKDTSIGEFSWDTSASNINKGWGVNEWSESDLMKLLNPEYEKNELEDESGAKQSEQYVNNSLYWNGEKGTCYNGENNATIECDFTNNNIPENLKNMIDTVTWNLGGYYRTNVSTKLMYNYERGTEVYKNNPTLWQGEVGLMYPSDYGYATGGGTLGRNTCLNYLLGNWNDEGYRNDCANTDWLLNVYKNQWTLSTDSYSSDCAFIVLTQGYVHASNITSAAFAVAPVLYLKPNVEITNKEADGSKSNPYNLSLD